MLHCLSRLSDHSGSVTNHNQIPAFCGKDAEAAIALCDLVHVSRAIVGRGLNIDTRILNILVRTLCSPVVSFYTNTDTLTA